MPAFSNNVSDKAGAKMPGIVTVISIFNRLVLIASHRNIVAGKRRMRPAGDSLGLTDCDHAASCKECKTYGEIWNTSTRSSVRLAGCFAVSTSFSKDSSPNNFGFETSAKWQDYNSR